MLLNETDDVEKYTNRSLVRTVQGSVAFVTNDLFLQFYRNVWDPTVESDGYKGMLSQEYMSAL